jgi:hypothetical protein
VLQKKILQSVKFVADNSEYVKINSKKVNEFLEKFQLGETVHWLHHSPFYLSKLSLDQQVNFILLMSAISFSYWGTPKWSIEYKNKKQDGAYGMLAALGRAVENGYPILNPKYLSEISEEDFEKILQGNVQIPLFYERLNFAREIGDVLIKKFNGDFYNAIMKADENVDLLSLIVDNFSNFADESYYKNTEIHFYKRAQLLTADILQIIPKTEYRMKQFSHLTACADYKLAQVLREYGLLEYSDSLARRIDQKIEIEKGSEEEVEIRASTIWVIELIKEKIRKQIENIDSMTIDEHIWLLSQNNSGMKPYHLTRTTAY